VKKVSFVIPVRKEEAYLRDAVASVLAQALGRRKREIILAIGPSEDRTKQISEELAARHKEVRVISNPSGLTSAGLNLAINASLGEVIVRVDAHSELQPNYVLSALEVLKEKPEVGNVGGVMAAEGKTDFQKAVAWAYRSPVGLGGGKFHTGGEAGEVETVYLGVFRKSALIEAGLFDESVVRGQDWELNQRLREKGWIVYFTPSMQAKYYPRSSLIDLAAQFFRTGLWRGKLSRKDFPNISLKYLAPPLLVILSLFWVPLWVYLLGIAFVALGAKGLGSAAWYLMAVLPTMHYTWGIGFMLGILFPKLAKVGG
jgi:glycosyltransferase involved in cell wall biosynthesis